MMKRHSKVPERPRCPLVLVFVDGIGLAAASSRNPFATCATPALSSLLGGPLTREQVGRREEALLLAIDACLGLPGLPQSATGQTTLFTGVNAAAHIGHHVAAFPGPRLRALLDEKSLFRRADARGLSATFANAFSPGFFEHRGDRAKRRRLSATVWAVKAANGVFRTVGDLGRHQAVSWDIERDHFARRLATEGSQVRVDEITAYRAGADLARLATAYDLVLFETFITDFAGHRRFGITAGDAIRRVDGLLGGLFDHRAPETTVVVTSDHGNLEESWHRRHTRNPVPLLVVGPASELFADSESLIDVTPLLLSAAEWH